MWRQVPNDECSGWRYPTVSRWGLSQFVFFASVDQYSSSKCESDGEECRSKLFAIGYIGSETRRGQFIFGRRIGEDEVFRLKVGDGLRFDSFWLRANFQQSKQQRCRAQPHLLWAKSPPNVDVGHDVDNCNAPPQGYTRRLRWIGGGRRFYLTSRRPERDKFVL